MIFVIGATGKVGRHVVSGLVERGRAVRALARDPDTAALPASVEVVGGDLSDAPGLEQHAQGSDAVFLVWPFFTDAGAAEVVDALASHAPRLVYLSAEAAGRRAESFWAGVERNIERSGVEWAFLRPTGFAANTLLWAPQIREAGVVRWPYGQAARSLIDERDIAAVAVRALTEGGHAGARHVLTGPATITHAEQVRAIGEAIGRPVRFEELSREEAAAELSGQVPDSALDTWAGFVETPEIVTTKVQDVTGRPARSFSQWAHDHAEDFR
jgi:uncharacterized protein YbjT (DUF2867 family)